MNYKLTNRISAQQQENELVMRLNNTSAYDAKHGMTHANRDSASDPIDMPKPKYGSWSEFNNRQTEPLPYW